MDQLSGHAEHSEPPPEVSLIEDPIVQKELLTQSVKDTLIREFLFSVFEPNVNLKGNPHQDEIVALKTNDIEAYRKVIEQTPEWKSWYDYLQSSYDELIESGQLTLATLDGKVAGLLGFRVGGSWKEKPVWEMSHGIVLPEFRNHRISSKLNDRTIERIKGINSESYIVSYTKSKQRISSLERSGAYVVSPRRYTKIEGGSAEERQSSLERRLAKEKEGWRVMLMNLGLKQQ